MLYPTGYSDSQQQQLDDDDDEANALCIHSPSYGTTVFHHPPPPPQAFATMEHSCRRPSKPSIDLVLPALDPKAQEVAAAIVPDLQPPRRHFLRKKPRQVNLSTIRANYQSSRSHIR
ncbi:hypothetical protein LRAMOSA01261 [Lichtheimia ramosa]|uniref:Uncharacterized protein n=1 Tax=Lichtheimia ramosa TaxID=688394 RepID=A0A077WLC8_9FUNG|nr:hypothetical protein LRAMOSA01261 [Lichtheimia ramosa]